MAQKLAPAGAPMKAAFSNAGLQATWCANRSPKIFPALIAELGSGSIFGIRWAIIVALPVLGVLNNGLDHVQIDGFLKILIRGIILLAALIINGYARRLKEHS